MDFQSVNEIFIIFREHKTTRETSEMPKFIDADSLVVEDFCFEFAE